MRARAKRLLLWSLPVALIVVGLIFAFRPQPLSVDIVAAERAPMRVVLEEDAITRVRDEFIVAAPIGGRLLRNPLEVGDPVQAGITPVASIEPSDPAFLDPRALAERQAAVQAAEAAEELARAQLEQASSEHDFAAAEVERARTLFGRGTLARQAVDDAERAARSTLAALEAARAALEVRRFELEQARAALITPADIRTGGASCPCVTVDAPVDGVVLQVLQKSETVVGAGAPLLSVGDPSELEVVADYLSTDAVRIRAGQKAFLIGWGGEKPLEAVVERVEPYGFTKVSALGIEEQRVNVILSITAPRDEREGIGHGYRVTAQVVVWEEDDVLQIPVTALFRRGETWAVFVVENGRARLREVVPGHRAGLAVEVLAGVTEGDSVVSNPSEDIRGGTGVEPSDGL